MPLDITEAPELIQERVYDRILSGGVIENAYPSRSVRTTGLLCLERHRP
jgi:hypothetical protein